jgi:hypothetical protein
MRRIIAAGHAALKHDRAEVTPAAPAEQITRKRRRSPPKTGSFRAPFPSQFVESMLPMRTWLNPTKRFNKARTPNHGG